MADRVDVNAILKDRRDKRREKLRQAFPRVRTVRVTPTRPEYREALRHMPTGIRFPSSGPAEWPDDQFTKRREREGAITVDRAESRPHRRAV